MNPSESVPPFIACQQSILLFYYALDRGDYPRAMAQIAPDCEWERGGVMLRGPRQIEESLRKRSATQVGRHVLSNFALLRQDAGTATAVFSVAVHLYDNGSPPSLPVPGSLPFLLADATGEFAQGPDKAWRIRKLDMQRVFSYSQEVISPLVPRQG